MALERIFFDGDSTGRVYADIIVNEGTMYISGLVASDLETGEMRYGTMEEETNLVLSNLKAILEKYGSDMEHVLRVDVVLSDFSQRDVMNSVYIKHFAQGKVPSRICYGDVAIHGDCKVEMAVIATQK